ncbi:MAG TPA: Holliday junction resolvase RuvX [Steroidobacteraceae bacterium]|nr:Holliday junction resolvase RuvX [Steroidobacteraceae bacterium]HRX90371.1 Holliday junction resolvase RuvX [Steroidobacteraceae bacterium]
MPDAVRLVLAFDFGNKRIGLASGDTLTRTAAPLATVVAHNGVPDWAAIGKQIAALQPAQLVVGEPYNADGTASGMTTTVRQFAAELARRFGLPVALIDERWSSLDAEERLTAQRASGERKRRVRREDIDARAAAVILERWFERQSLGGVST